MNFDILLKVIEAYIFSAGMPVSEADIKKLFSEEAQPTTVDVRRALETLANRYHDSGVILHQVASGYRFQVSDEVLPYLGTLWAERPTRYSRALLETLALIAYRQPITRGEIEDIRGVVVSTGTIKTLLEQEWVRIVGHRDVPGRPALYATTREFLDHFNLKNLEELPPLSEMRDLQAIEQDLMDRVEQGEIETLDNDEKDPLRDPLSQIVLSISTNEDQDSNIESMG
jgi:segregation and condensation protein B